MADPLLVLKNRLAPAFAAVAGEDADPVVRPSDRADAQANGALPLAKRLGRPPRDIAADVLARVDLTDMCDAVEVAGAGFVNVTFSDAFLVSLLGEVAGDPRLGVRAADKCETVVVDYSAPNVAKEMHVGHLRSTIIGDSIVRLAEFAGHTVLRENHVGDWGTPFGMLIEHLLDLGETEAAHELSVGDLDSFYKQAAAKFKESEAFQDRARQRVVLLQGGDDDTLRLWRVLVGESTAYFESVYSRLGVRLTNDDVRGESFYNDRLTEIVARLERTGLLVESDGAQVVFPPGYANREGEPLPLIIRNRVGGYNYATTDLATVVDRVERLGATLMLYVVGAPQAQHLRMVWDVSRLAGWMPDSARAEHITFGSVLGSDRKMLRSRSGASVKLSDLLTEAVDRARAKVLDKNPDLSGPELDAIASAVGIGAVKYADLSGDRIKDYLFDWERMLADNGDTGPYLQYAYARIQSIFRTGKVDVDALVAVTPSITHPSERSLAMRLLGFDAAVWETIDNWSPHRMCTYLFSLASDFTGFYDQCKVLKADNEMTRRCRLLLCDLTGRTLALGLSLLGISAPERM